LQWGITLLSVSALNPGDSATGARVLDATVGLWRMSAKPGHDADSQSRTVGLYYKIFFRSAAWRLWLVVQNLRNSLSKASMSTP